MTFTNLRYKVADWISGGELSRLQNDLMQRQINELLPETPFTAAESLALMENPQLIHMVNVARAEQEASDIMDEIRSGVRDEKRFGGF